MNQSYTISNESKRDSDLRASVLAKIYSFILTWESSQQDQKKGIMPQNENIEETRNG